MDNTENIISIVSVLLLITVAVWSFYRLSTKTSAILYLGIFLVISNILLWRRVFIMDKNTAVSFEKLKHDVARFKKD